jgi:hypothetical protein
LLREREENTFEDRYGGSPAFINSAGMIFASGDTDAELQWH